jgi:hypothetical protein
MKKRLIKVLFTLPVLIIDIFSFPLVLIYWIATGVIPTRFLTKLWEL